MVRRHHTISCEPSQNDVGTDEKETRSFGQDGQPISMEENHASQEREEWNKNGDEANGWNGTASSTMPSVWQSIGRVMEATSDVVNDNIIVARYATIASIGILTLYGFANTPLLYRHKQISDIATSSFTKRRTIHGRLVGIVKHENNTLSSESLSGASTEQPTVCLVHHLSPLGRLLSRSAFNFSIQKSPRAKLGVSLKDRRDLLKIEIAGIQAPPQYYATRGMEQPGEWLDRLVQNQTPVACQLLSRRVRNDELVDTGGTNSLNSPPGQVVRHTTETEDVAVCRVFFRPPRNNRFQLFRDDLAETLLGQGRATLSSSGLFVDRPGTHTVYGNTNIKTLQGDAKYMERLERSELEAVKESLGLWSDEQVRATRQDLVQEANFETTASVWQKLWRLIRRE